MVIPLYYLHPMVVHFPLALLSTGLVLALWDAWARSAKAAESAAWLLWVGTASAWIAFGLGLLAERTAPHVPAAWETMADHQALATWTCAVFTALSAFSLVARRKGWAPLPCARLLAAGWLLGFALLAAAAGKGGELVFRHGLGVEAREG